MKPLNLNTTGCDPVSSNCVVWQGPDIPCINLCKGDSISDVVYKLATELCNVLEDLDVSTYILPEKCFTDQSCEPKDFHALMQAILDRLCDCCPPDGSTSTSGFRTAGESTTGCPDCIVPVVKCFQYTNEFGDLVTTMQLTDYVKTIGNKVCNIINDITAITAAVNDLELRVTALENVPSPTVFLPQVTPTCIITPSAPVDMNVFVSVLEQQFCQLVTVTGNPLNLSQSISSQCVGLNNSPALGTNGGIMSSIPGWIISANTVASSLNNMWLTLCDVRSAVRNIQLTCCPSGCDGVEVTMTATLVGPILSIYFTGTIPSGFTECNPNGNLFKITDALGNSMNVYINTLNYINSGSPFSFDIGTTVLNPVLDMSISSDVCYKSADGSNTCQFCLTYNITNTANCPTISLTPDPYGTGVLIFFTPVYIPATYTLEIWNSSFTAIVSSQTQFLNIGGLATFSFTSVLNPSTVYNARLVINISGNERTCPYIPFTTAPGVCLPASSASGVVNVPALCPTCGTAIGFDDAPTIDGTYVDLTTNHLFEYSGSAFSDIIIPVNAESLTGTVKEPLSFAGRTWVITSDTDIQVWSDPAGTPTLDTTVVPGVDGIVSMVYDTNLNLVFFAYNDSVTGFRRIGTINPSTYSVTLNVGPAFSAGVFFAQELYFNPVTFEKYVRVSDGDIYVLSAGATGLTLKATLSATGVSYLRYAVFDSVNGNAWVASNDTTNTEEILVFNGTTYALITTLNTTTPGMTPYVGNVDTNAMAFYVNGSNKSVFVIYRSVAAPYDYMITTFNGNSPYNETIFMTESVGDLTPLPRQIFYSNVFEKLVYTRVATINMYNVSTSAVNLTPTTTLVNSVLDIVEDTVNKLLVFVTNVASPTDNLWWLRYDTSVVTECTDNRVSMYLGNSGPYQFNSTTESWDAMCTSAAIGSSPAPGAFTVTAAFTANVQTAALLYSINNGVTWIPLVDNTGALYANPGAWLTGRVYTNPTTVFDLKITFSTSDSCGLEGPVMSLP